MAIKKKAGLGAAEMRRRAEAKDRENGSRHSKSLESLSAEDIEQTLHELRVHQIELEMQNDELRRYQAELEAARARYFDFYNLAPVGYLTISTKGLILEANITMVELLGLTRAALIRRPFSSFIFAEDQDCYYLFIRKLLATAASDACELRLVNKENSLFWVRMEAVLVHQTDGTAVVRAVISEITDRVHLEAEIRQLNMDLQLSNESLEQRIVEKTADLTTAHQELTVQYEELAKMHEAQRRNVKIQAVLRDIGDSAVMSESLDEFYVTLHRLVMKVFPAANFYISMYDASLGKILFPYCVDETGTIKPQRPVSKGLTEYLVRMDQVLHLRASDLVKLVEDGEVSVEMAPTVNWLGAPLNDASGKAFGAMVMYWTVETQLFHEIDSALLEVIAAQVSLAINRLQVSEALRESEERFASGLMIKLIVDPRDGAIVTANDAALAFYGYSAEEIKQLNIAEIVIDPTIETKRKKSRTESAGSEPFVFLHRLKNGSAKYVEVYSGPIIIGGLSFHHYTIIDVSARKKAEEELQVSTERLESVMEASGAGIWDRDLKTQKVFFDSRWKAMRGYEEHEFENTLDEWQSRVHPTEERWIQKGLADSLKRDKVNFEIEYRMQHKDGGYRWIKAIAKITRDEKNQPIRLTGIDVDITDQKKLVELQIESETRLKDFAQAVPDISYIIDADGQFIEVFGADETLFPIPPNDIRQRTVIQVYPSAMAKKFMADIKQSIAKKSVLRIEYLVEVAKGQRFLVGRVSPMRYNIAGKKVVAVVLQDFTERWKAESLLHNSYQMRRQSDFLNDLVQGKSPINDEAIEFATKHGLSFSQPLFCCMVSCEQRSVADHAQKSVFSDMPGKKDEIIAALGDEKGRIVWDCREAIGVMYNMVGESGDGRLRNVETAERLRESICNSAPGFEVLVGVGEACTGIDGLQKSYQQACRALIATRCRTEKNGKVFHYRDLGIMQLLTQDNNNETAQDFVRSTIGKIIDYDRDKGAEYLLTLEVILTTDSNKDAGQILFLHPNTVLFRRRRIEKLLGVSLEDFETKVALAAAVKLNKLNKQSNLNK